MTTLTIGTRGRITLPKEVLRCLGVKRGDKIELDLLPNGHGLLRAPNSSGSIDAFIGLLAGRSEISATIDEINTAIAECWANRMK